MPDVIAASSSVARRANLPLAVRFFGIAAAAPASRLRSYGTPVRFPPWSYMQDGVFQFAVSPCTDIAYTKSEAHKRG